MLEGPATAAGAEAVAASMQFEARTVHQVLDVIDRGLPGHRPPLLLLGPAIANDRPASSAHQIEQCRYVSEGCGHVGKIWCSHST